MDLLSELKSNPFVLAPMAGITDCAFRSFMREMGAGIVITELVSATGLKYSSERTRHLMKFETKQHPVGIQLFGEDLDALEYAAKEVEQMGADFVDLNFGCPVPKVVKKGAGSAVLKDLPFMRTMLRKMKSAVNIPVTIKVRTGWDQTCRNTIEVCQIAYDEGITWVSVHGRTRAQAYTGQSDWDYISEVKTRSKVPVIGNGDIHSSESAIERLENSGCDGVMIGRGCLKNPWIFRDAKSLFFRQGNERDSRDFRLVFELLFENLKRHNSDRMTALQTKKLAAWFSSGYPESAQFRKDIFQISEPLEVLNAVTDYFTSLQEYSQKDTSSEPFLMGGHG